MRGEEFNYATSMNGECHLDTLVSTAVFSEESATQSAQMSVYGTPRDERYVGKSSMTDSQKLTHDLPSDLH
jgi:hypothetical protein